jgi:hypothetical protein
MEEAEVLQQASHLVGQSPWADRAPRRGCAACGRVLAAAIVLSCTATAASGQDWPTGTLHAFDRRVTLGGEVLFTVAPDDNGGFNATSYERHALRLMRLGLVSAFRAGERLSAVLELRAEGDSGAGKWGVGPYAAYVSLRPTGGPALELQVGRIASAFGGFARRPYGTENLLIGYPLAYQYLTSLRHDAIPRSADELLLMRAHGAYVGYGAGRAAYAPGVSMATVFRYDTGALARVRMDGVGLEVLGSVTVGSLSHPGADGNDAPQVAGRVAWRPVAGFALGGSASRAGFLSDRVNEWLPEASRSRSHDQRAFGADVEYSRDHWLVRTEIVSSSWAVPAVGTPAILGRLRATSWLAEGRYTIAPGAYVAGRIDSLLFSTVHGSYQHATWDADVWRAEVALGYALTRQLRVKVGLQHNRRDGGSVRRLTLGAAQAVLWF